MKIFIDTDPYIYNIAHSLQPSCWWVDGEWHENYFDTLRMLKTQERPKGDMEKEQFLLPPWEVKPRVNSVLNSVFRKLKSEIRNEIKIPPGDVDWIISSKENFRKDIDSEYKSNRPSRPRWYEETKKTIINKTKAWSVPGVEADDVIAYLHWDSFYKEGPQSSIIAAIDKDFDIVPGWHYHLKDSYVYYVTEEEAAYKLKEQLITGDKSDNIPGIKGKGEKKAKEWMIENPTDSWEEFKELLITTLYKEQFDNPEQRYDTNFSLLDIGGVWSEKLGLELPEALKELRNV